jgi:HPt (histidine-containing phosphotransfer) domain-containing protein
MTNPNNQPEKVCNFDYLKELSNGNEKFIRDMIDIFLTEIPEEVRNLEKGIETRNFDQVKQAAHKLRSTIPFVGIDKHIEKEIHEIEKLAENGTGIDQMKTLFVKVRDICEKAYAELKS